MKLQARILFLLAGVLFSAGLQAGSKFTINTLMQTLAKKSNSSATFIEYRYSSLLTKPVRISGKLVYNKPDTLIKENISPTRETLKIVSDSVEFTRLENGKKISRVLGLEDFPFLESMVVGLRATFAGDLNKLEKYYKVDLSGDVAAWRLTLNSKSVLTDPDKLFEGSVKSIVIDGSKSEIRKIEMVDNDGEKTVITISPL